MTSIWQNLKIKIKKLLTKVKLERLNLKIDLSFWTFVPYKEPINYVIDGKTYKPTSYRFLCFALIVVTSQHEQDYALNHDLKRVFTKKND